jgi:hypothetical protein
MPIQQDLTWFKNNFGTPVNAAVKGTPFTLDMVAAIAYQETGKEIWGPLSRKGLAAKDILKVCTGDILDFPKRSSAWPANRTALEAHPKGKEMFKIARTAFEAMAAKIPTYQQFLNRPDKFCHGYGIFQYDIQFFKDTDPDYFLRKDYEIFEKSLGKCLIELKAKAKKLGLDTKPSLTDMEMAMVAIAYNTGGFNPAKGLKQGHSVDMPGGGKKFYGEFFMDYLTIAKSIPFAPPAPPLPPAKGKTYRVETATNPLNLRKQPRIPAANEPDNIIGKVARNALVKAVSDTPKDGFLEIDAVVGGKTMRGYGSAKLLKKMP